MELERKKKLQSDPLANVLGPLWIECRRCKSRVKLSFRSSYATAHWKKHRQRCLERSEAKVAAIRFGREMFSIPSPLCSSNSTPSTDLHPDETITTFDEADFSPKDPELLNAATALSILSASTPDTQNLHSPHDVPSRHVDVEDVSKFEAWREWNWGRLKELVYSAEGRAQRMQ
ncbi:hypothetical protein OF83DRAFT_1176284 [Amylostereum chailletii]|nr:hypothetical protein OF83DRAFT_1176284 [Amylostereum chailletii]